jgi:hypothetical protein
MTARLRRYLEIKLTKEEARALKDALEDVIWQEEVCILPDEQPLYVQRLRRVLNRINDGLTWAKGVA